MPLASVETLVSVLRESQILPAAQLAELVRDLTARFAEPHLLARELVARGWLTPFQANRLLQDRAGDLILGPYVLLERLGEGGMGQVFKARHLQLDRVAALKIIRKEHMDNPAALKRFEREARAASRLSHVNIAQIFDADVIKGVPYLAMEYLEGIDLNRLVKANGPLPPARAADYARQAAHGLEHIREQRLVHRDVKPDNLFLTNAAVVKILDLGLCRLDRIGDQADGGTKLTEPGMVMGTLDYIAPEQTLNSSTVDIRGDLYSLGCTLYYLLTGKPPFPGGGPVQKLAWHLHAEPPKVEERAPHGLPEGLAAVVRRMMAKKREERYQSPADVADALAPFCPDRPRERISTDEILAIDVQRASQQAKNSTSTVPRLSDTKMQGATEQAAAPFPAVRTLAIAAVAAAAALLILVLVWALVLKIGG